MQVNDLLGRGVDQVLPDKSALISLLDKKKIRVYLGIDPTGPKLHVGHTIPLRKLQAFADLGHEAILVFGTGTVLAGDPSQRKEARKKITQQEVEDNIKDWKQQAKKILDFNKVQIKLNGDWLLKLNLKDILEIASNVSAVQLFKRDMFQERIAKGDTIWTHELLYPLLQGYDSVVIDTDLEIGGTDQVFNMLIGRELQKKINGREKFVLTTPLISGTDGLQMTKSTGNCIWLDDSPDEMFGKVMSIADSQLEEYWLNLTDFDEKELKSSKPIDAKKKLGKKLVEIYHDQQSAEKAQQNFESTFQNKSLPDNVLEIHVKEYTTVSEVVAAQVGSMSEAKRLFTQNAIEIDNKITNETKQNIKEDQIIKIGKKKFVKIKLDK